MKKINETYHRNLGFVVSVFFMLSVFVSCKSDKQRLVDEIHSGEQKLFNDSTKRLDDSVAVKMMKHYVAFADTYKDDTTSGEYLFKAAELNNSLHFYKEAIALYDRLMKDYPAHPKSSTALFMQAFIFDTGLHNPEQAKAKYKEFIDKYPNHQLAASAEASLDQLNAGLSDEELVKLFEARHDSAAKKAN